MTIKVMYTATCAAGVDKAYRPTSFGVCAPSCINEKRCIIKKRMVKICEEKESAKRIALLLKPPFCFIWQKATSA